MQTNNCKGAVVQMQATTTYTLVVEGSCPKTAGDLRWRKEKKGHTYA